jgi:hypothetical protein
MIGMYEFELVVNGVVEYVFRGVTEQEVLARYEYLSRILDDGDWGVDAYLTYPHRVEVATGA